MNQYKGIYQQQDQQEQKKMGKTPWPFVYNGTANICADT